MSFIAAALITGGAGVGIAALSKKGGGGGGVSYPELPQSKEAIESRKRLFEFASGEPPEVPLRKIAPLPPRTEERDIARQTAKELIQPQDIFALPEVQGIIQEATVRGNLLANRLGRGLQSAGAFTTTPGRDVLGRVVTDVQKNLASSLAPFAMEERARRRGLIPVLEGLGLTEEERARGFSQAELDALFEKEFAESKQLETFTIPLLKSIIGLQPGVQPIIQGQKPSAISELAPLIGPLLSAIMMSGGGGGGLPTTKAGLFTPGGASAVTSAWLG